MASACRFTHERVMRSIGTAERRYLRDDTITPSTLLRLAAAFPDTVDTVFRKVLRRRHFTWSEHGETLLSQRKLWYYEREPRPGVTIIGNRLTELASRR
jgi:hypothetical protein